MAVRKYLIIYCSELEEHFLTAPGFTCLQHIDFKMQVLGHAVCKRKTPIK